MIFIIAQTLTQITYFFIFHLDLNKSNGDYLPMFNFLCGITNFFLDFQMKKQYILACSLMTAEYGIGDKHFEHLFNLINLLKVSIDIEDFSLSNTKWVNFILDLEVKLMPNIMKLIKKLHKFFSIKSNN